MEGITSSTLHELHFWIITQYPRLENECVHRSISTCRSLFVIWWIWYRCRIDGSMPKDNSFLEFLEQIQLLKVAIKYSENWGIEDRGFYPFFNSAFVPDAFLCSIRLERSWLKGSVVGALLKKSLGFQLPASFSFAAANVFLKLH